VVIGVEIESISSSVYHSLKVCWMVIKMKSNILKAPHSSLIQEVIDYQYYRGEHPVSFIEYYFKVHHPIYNQYYYARGDIPYRI
jgi:hypothetical protein